MARARAHRREAKPLEKLSDIALVKRDAEPQVDHALEVDSPPARHAIDLGVRASFNNLRQFGQLIPRQTRLRPAHPIVDETVRTVSVEPVNPIPQRLAIHAADPGCFATIHPVADRRQRQQPAALVCILRPLGQTPKRLSRKILTQFHRTWHG